MKTRNGFISNSSSSSFIVGFSKIPQSVVELEKMMFGDDCGIAIDYYGIYSKSTLEIASRVFDDIKNGVAERVDKKKTLKELLNGYFPGYPPFKNSYDKESRRISDNYYKKTGKYLWDDDDNGAIEIQKEWRKAHKQERNEEWKRTKLAAIQCLEENWPKMKGKKVFVFEYSDNTDGEGVLEHGGIFEKLPNIVVSHH